MQTVFLIVGILVLGFVVSVLLKQSYNLLFFSPRKAVRLGDGRAHDCSRLLGPIVLSWVERVRSRLGVYIGTLHEPTANTGY